MAVWCCITALTSMILSVCWTCGSFTAFCTSGPQASVVPRTGAVGTWHCIVTATPTILSMYWICGNFTVFWASESHAPALRHNGPCPPLRSLHCTGASQSVFWISSVVGTVSAQLAVLHRRGMNCAFRDIRPLSLSHSVYDLNSLRDLLDGRHPFLYCRFISLNCTCVVSTAFWIFRVARHLAVTLSVAQLECSPLCRIAGT